jgi:predicted glycoside hydrolase/deacetylase ChbG (UPF0249 family)
VIIVTADDFGLCPAVNEAICLLHDRGIVARTSFIVSTDYFDASVDQLLERPALEVGIHLDLTDGLPVAGAAAVPTLVNRHGRFRGGLHYGVLARILSGRISRRDIRAEWRAQIAKATRAGIAIRHLNAHGHLHLLPQLHSIVLDLLEEFRIPNLRLVSSASSNRGRLFQLCSQPMILAMRERGLAVSFPDRILGLGHQGSLTKTRILESLGGNGEGCVELIVHPSLGDNAYHRRWRYAGQREMHALLDEETASVLRAAQ